MPHLLGSAFARFVLRPLGFVPRMAKGPTVLTNSKEIVVVVDDVVVRLPHPDILPIWSLFGSKTRKNFVDFVVAVNLVT